MKGRINPHKFPSTVILGNFRKPFYLAFFGAVFFVFGAVFLAVTFLADFFGDGFDFLLAAFLAAAFAAFSSLAGNCLTVISGLINTKKVRIIPQNINGISNKERCTLSSKSCKGHLREKN